MSFRWECLMCHTGGEAATIKERDIAAGAHADKWEVSALFHGSSHVPFRLWEEHPHGDVGRIAINDTVTEFAGRIGW